VINTDSGTEVTVAPCQQSTVHSVCYSTITIQRQWHSVNSTEHFTHNSVTILGRVMHIKHSVSGYDTTENSS